MSKEPNFINAEVKDKRIEVLIRFHTKNYGTHKVEPVDRDSLIKDLKQEGLLEHFLNSNKFEI